MDVDYTNHITWVENMNKYRCETCKFYTIDPTKFNKCPMDYETIHNTFPEIEDMLVGRIAKVAHHETINSCGCASHSDFPF